MNVRTWQVEATVVAVILLGVAALKGFRLVEYFGTLAVFFAFLHAQVADRLAEREAARVQPDVECHALLGKYFLAKEFLWLSYFATLGAWSAIVGVAVFLVYPFWRRWWRAKHPF